MRVAMRADFRRAARDVKTWSQNKVQRVKDTVNESAINVQTGAKSRCQVNTGRLRSSIAIEPASGRGFTLRVGTKVFYAPYVEWGTGIFSEHPTEGGRQTPWAFPIPKSGKTEYNFKRIEIEGQPYYVTRGSKPHPFLFPAFEEERPRYLSAIRGVLKE
jgi:HK97 gp10 family phage protein